MSDGIDRRDFLRRAWWSLAGVLVLESGIALAAPLRPKLQAGSFGAKFNIGGVEEVRVIPVGTVVPFMEGRFYLSHVESGFLALYRRCTHLGCVIPWSPDEPAEDPLAPQGRFSCPCHGSIFDRYGVVHAGPAPRPMDTFPIIVEGNEVLVDTGTTLQRSSFRDSQAKKL